MSTITWSKKELAIISAVFLGSMVISGILIKVLKPEINTASLLVTLLLFLSTLSIFRFFLKRKGLTWSEFGFKEMQFKYIALCFLAMFFVTFVGGFLSNALSNLLGLEAQPDDLKKMLSGSNVLLIILNLKIGAALLTPLTEEMFFKGLIYRFLRQRKTFVFSVVVSSVLFGLSHADIGMLPFTLILGFTTAYMFEKTQNILYPFLIHMGANNLAANIILMGIL